MPPPENCPNCGAEVPPKALACPECGADEKTGWSDEAAAQRLGLPDENFDYDEFVERELNPEKKVPRPPIGWFWWVVALVTLLALLSLWLGT